MDADAIRFGSVIGSSTIRVVSFFEGAAQEPTVIATASATAAPCRRIWGHSTRAVSGRQRAAPRAGPAAGPSVEGAAEIAARVRGAGRGRRRAWRAVVVVPVRGL